MDVVRHHTPRKQSVPRAIKFLQRICDDPGNRKIPKETFTASRIQGSLYPASMELNQLPALT